MIRNIFSILYYAGEIAWVFKIEIHIIRSTLFAFVYATIFTAKGTRHVPYGITQCYLPLGRSDIFVSAPSKLKLVLDSATPEVCKAELT